MSGIKAYRVESRFGPMFGAEGEKGIRLLTFPNKGIEVFLAELAKMGHPERDLSWVEPGECESGRALAAYLGGGGKTPEARIDLGGQPGFRKEVLEIVASIPYGQTMTYGRIAADLGRPKAARAVGQAVGANPVPVFIACHRVMGADGALTGFGGGVALKEALLNLEIYGGSLL